MIEVKELTKRFGDFTAVDRLSFNVEAGEVLGFLGPNGAGKSTTMKMIVGYLTPTSGSSVICGYDVRTHALAAKKLVGYLPEGAPAYGEMTAREFLKFMAQMRNIPRKQRNDAIDRVIADVHLDAVIDKQVEALSKGYKRRVGLAASILHDPKVLILDEPTDGLDPNQKHEVRKLIQNMAQDKIIVISTHILEEVDAICTRAMIIAHGQKLADGTPAELMARARTHQAVTMRLEANSGDVRSQLLQLPNVADVIIDGKQLVVLPKAGQAIYGDVLDAVQANHWPVAELYVEQGRLDDVFRDLTTGSGEAA